MKKFQSLLASRLQPSNGEKSKMNALAEYSSQGGLSSFSGMFGNAQISEEEKQELQALLVKYKEEHQDIEKDFLAISSLTLEVKAISQQAILLHGERIKKVQQILKQYKEGAFSNWLLQTYGNRQTPYNFLQYYEFYLSLAPEIRTKATAMPRQVIYSLSTRKGDLSKKEQFIQSYQGETKKELLQNLRKVFPLPSQDKRKENVTQKTIKTLQEALSFIKKLPHPIPSKEKQKIQLLLEEIIEYFE